MQLTIFSEDIIFLQKYKSTLVLKTTRLQHTLLSTCITGCANVVCRNVFRLCLKIYDRNGEGNQ